MSWNGWDLRAMSILRQALGGISGGRVLDVATGEGEFLRTLAACLASCMEIIGVDTVDYTDGPESIFREENIRFLKMDAERLDFDDESFDTVSISSSLHHLRNPQRCLVEMKRVLTTDGHLIIRETHRDARTEPKRTDMYIHHWVAEIDSALGDVHNQTFTKRELVDLARSLGLINVAFYDVSNRDSDPTDKAAIEECGNVIERYLRCTKRLLDGRALRRRGEELRERLGRTGVQWEPELIIVGEKR
jgi:SAM-dependent methyltransferase